MITVESMKQSERSIEGSRIKRQDIIEGHSDEGWTVMEVLRESSVFLERKGFENPRLQAERLMAHVLQCERIDLYLRFEDSLDRKTRDVLKSLLLRRARQEPLQYILGTTEFMSLQFTVNSHVLIPRPETETLVETMINRMKHRGKIRLLDVGVGSGNISVSLAFYLPDALVVGVDVEEKILEVAADNARSNGVSDRIRLCSADVTQEIFHTALEAPFDGVVSNPPYVSSAEWNTLPAEIRQFEPRIALCDEGSGLRFFRAIAPAMLPLLRCGGIIAFEVGDSQAGDVVDILTSTGYRAVETVQDLNGIKRVVTAIKPECGRGRGGCA